MKTAPAAAGAVRRAARAWLYVSWLGLAGLGGCSTLNYYVDSVIGHLRVLEAARPMDDWVADPATPAPLRTRLEAVQQMRRFAVTDLGLPDNASYRSYADLHRPYVVWNVFATPPLSLELREWCFPIAGCVKYRGYFDQANAERYGASLRAEGLDVQVAGIPAYSTLGFTPDPVLSTFINYPEGEVARLIFHELAHQKVYLPGDTTFNESFATAVEEEGVRRWLKAQNDPAKSAAYARFETRKQRFLALLLDARAELQAIYDGPETAPQKRVEKAEALARLHDAYQKAKADPSDPLYGYTGYDGYFAQPINNAYLAAIATYSRLVPAFVKLLAENDGNLPRFYAAVERLSHETQVARDTRLEQLLAQGPHAAPAASRRLGDPT